MTDFDISALSIDGHTSMAEVAKTARVSRRFISAAEVVADPITPFFQVEGQTFALKHTVNLIAGPPKAGKSAVLIPIMREEIARGGSILIITEERVGTLVRRLAGNGVDTSRVQFERSYAAHSDSDTPEDLAAVPPVTFTELDAGLEDDIRAAGFTMVIIDPAIKFKPDLKMDYGPVYEYCLRMQQLCDRAGLTVFLTHHWRKSRAGEDGSVSSMAEMASGSNAWAGAVRMQLACFATRDEETGALMGTCSISAANDVVPASFSYVISTGKPLFGDTAITPPPLKVEITGLTDTDVEQAMAEARAEKRERELATNKDEIVKRIEGMFLAAGTTMDSNELVAALKADGYREVNRSTLGGFAKTAGLVNNRGTWAVAAVAA